MIIEEKDHTDTLLEACAKIPLRRFMRGEWLAEEPVNGGKPSKGTSADKRLKENKPAQPVQPKQPVIPQKKPPMKGK